MRLGLQDCYKWVKTRADTAAEIRQKILLSLGREILLTLLNRMKSHSVPEKLPSLPASCSPSWVFLNRKISPSRLVSPAMLETAYYFAGAYFER